MPCGCRDCGREAMEGSDFCLFHMPAEEKEARGLWARCMEEFYALVAAGEGDFRGFVLRDLDLPKNLGTDGEPLVIEHPLDLSDATFVGTAVFSQHAPGRATEFRNRVDLRNASFHDKANFGGATFTWPMSFNNISFDSRADFIKTSFERDAAFDMASFRDGAVFWGARFVGTVSFSHTLFRGDASFDGASYRGNISFDGATIIGGVSFKGASFDGDVSFFHVSFSGGAAFCGALFDGNADFVNSTFEKEAHFEGCHFRQAAFNNVRFKDRAFFNVLRTRKDGHRATRFERADFSEAYFEKGGSFDGCLFWEADFGDASIQYVSFDGVDLDNVRFAGAQMEFAYLADARWSALPGRSRLRRLPHYLSVSDERYVIREELDIPTSGDVEDRIEAYRAAEGTYRRIKHSLTNEGAYGMAGEFYIHEMRMKRDRYWHQRRYLKWLGFWISALMTGYGEKGRNVIMTALAIVAFYAIAYHALGAISQDGGGTHCPTLSECVYFSLVTFTTLGYGDYAPIARYQLLAVSEAFIGAFMIALFVLVFGRKVMR